MTKSRAFFFMCLSFISGLFLSSIFKISQSFLLGIIILGFFLIFLSFKPSSKRESLLPGKSKKFLIVGLCVLLFALGIFRLQISISKIEKAPVQNFFEKEIILIGKVSEESKIGAETLKFIFLLEKGNLGKILITTNRYPEYYFGDRLKIRGVLKEPKNFNNFNYKNYLAKDGIYAEIYFPEIEFIENSGDLLRKTIFSFKRKLKESLNNFLNLPQSGLMEALIFGDEENIPKTWKEKFNLTGTRHIAAVSGMNITIISSLILNFLLFLGFWRNQAFYFSIILIFLYILMIGAPASAIRAGIMGLLFLTAQHLGRISIASRALVFTAAFMLFLNPLLLRYDVGFQLSFLAIFGLIYLQPIFQDFFKKIPNHLSLRTNLSATLGAQIFTLPILIYNFGQIPLISPLPNIFILPILPFLTILGFFLALSGIIFRLLGWVLSFPAWFLLSYVLKVIEFSSKVPLASLNFENFSWVFLLISYLILGIITWRLQERFTRPSFLR